MSERGWIGVDFDGTLVKNAHWDGYSLTMGEGVPKMVARVKRWLKAGRQVKIFTARAEDFRGRRAVEAFCQANFGQVLPITNKKDYDMVEYWDDRAVQVIPDTGERADGKS